MLIGLNGRFGSGKDTVYQILYEEITIADVERVAFADKLKESAAAALGIPVEVLEYLKGEEEWHYRADDGSWRPQGYARSFNMRTFLQRYGTEAHRDVFGQDFWIDSALPPDLDHTGRIVVVTDMRFPNEMERVKDLGGYCVYVFRPQGENKAHKHPSEQDLPKREFDWTISNDGSLDHLRVVVLSMWNDLMNYRHSHTI